MKVKKIEEYALVIADTVTITMSTPDILTKHNKNLTDISYELNGDEESDSPDAPDGDAALARKIQEEDDTQPGQRVSKRLASTYDAMKDLQASAAEREKKQIQLMDRRKKQKKRGRKNDVNMRDGGNLDDMRMKEIEDLLQEFDLEEDIVEDENIFGLDGVLDIGELVAQTFRLKLDPYPKKPGSEPVSYSITG